MRIATMAALGAFLLLGASAAVLLTAAGQESVAGTTGTDTTGPTNSTCIAPGYVTLEMRWARLVGNNTSLLPPWLGLNESAYQEWLSENSVNGTLPQVCHPQGRGHGHGHGFGPMGPPTGVPSAGRCQNQTA
ncbi:MAG TPA: hypothetical protein VJ547_02660 [Candidatus Thermoplasmatota archaeon]|nr:hypothetical protein [Candidatus Thermoplasmatota archaeon]